MISALVLINVQCGQVNETAQALLEIDGVAEVYSVTGEYDLVALLRLQPAVARSPPSLDVGRNCHVRSTPPLASFVRLCYNTFALRHPVVRPAIVGVRDDVSHRERRLADCPPTLLSGFLVSGVEILLRSG